MTSVPIMPLNVEEFFGSPEVEDMDAEQAAMWLLLIAECWRRKTLLPADDRKLARILGIDVRRWRSHYKPVFEPLMVTEMSATVGRTVADFYRIPKVNTVWDQVAKRIAKTKADAAHARAAKAAKHGKVPSGPEPKKPSAPEPVTAAATEPAPALHQNYEEGRDAAHPKAGRLALPTPTGKAGALPPRVNGHVERSARTGSPSLKGGSPTAPSEALLKSRLVQAPLDDDDDEPKRPNTGGLFGALEAAIRHGKSEED